MRNNETGEFELVVGNRQLLSGFFIVVLLFAVAFAMGYVVGQNSPKALRAASVEPAPVSLTPSDARPQPAQSIPAATPPAETAKAPATEAAKGQPTTQPPAADTPAPAPAPAAAAAPGTYCPVRARPITH